MKKFSFSLQKLLDYKEQLFDAERRALADMRAALARMEQEREDMSAERATRTADFCQKAARGIPAVEVETHKNYLTMLDFSIRQKNQQIELQNQAIDKQADKVREAKLEISTIEKLRERKLEEYNYAASKEEELFIEEFVTNTKAVKAG